MISTTLNSITQQYENFLFPPVPPATSKRCVWSKKAAAKLYFYCDPAVDFSTTANLNNSIKINRCTLVETTLDSLGLKIYKNKTIYIPLNTGRTYYFRRIISNYAGLATATLSACSAADFWLNGYFSGMGTYRHYYLNEESGLKLLVEEK